MSTINRAIVGTQGRFESSPSVSAGTNLGTTATLIRAGVTELVGGDQTVKVGVYNPNTSAVLTLGHDSAITAQYTGSAGPHLVPPEQSIEFCYKGSLPLYIVASATSSKYHVAYTVVKA